MARRNSIENEQLTDTRYYILLCLTRPAHGYALMGRIRAVSGGEFEVGPGSLYTSLRKLLAAGAVEMAGTDDSERKVYALTPAGRGLLLRDYARRRRIVQQSETLLRAAREKNGGTDDGKS